MEHYQVVIIGAGAAGLMCALTAGQRGRKVLLLDHADAVGRKILTSGGGHCNFTNLWVQSENYISDNPKFCKSALSRFTPDSFISLLEKYNILYHEKKAGQLFCSPRWNSTQTSNPRLNKSRKTELQGFTSSKLRQKEFLRGNKNSQQIVKLLLEECRMAGVKIQTKCAIKKIEKEESFTIKTNAGDYEADSLVIATGGLSMSEIGASGFGYDVAKQFGLNVIPTYPALVPFTLNRNADECVTITPQSIPKFSGCPTLRGSSNKHFHSLAGISVDALVSCNGQSFRESILFTHKGLSGPAILQISNYWNKGDEIVINLLPDLNLAQTIKQWQKERPKAELKNLMSELLPKRIVLTFLKLNKPINQYNQKEISKIAETFHKWRIIPSGTEGYKIAEVTKGGVDTKELSSKTFESHKVKGLYFIGEVLDVTGELGGFNLHWAWASGYCAGQFV